MMNDEAIKRLLYVWLFLFDDKRHFISFAK